VLFVLLVRFAEADAGIASRLFGEEFLRLLAFLRERHRRIVTDPHALPDLAAHHDPGLAVLADADGNAGVVSSKWGRGLQPHTTTSVSWVTGTFWLQLGSQIACIEGCFYITVQTRIVVLFQYLRHRMRRYVLLVRQATNLGVRSSELSGRAIYHDHGPSPCLISCRNVSATVFQARATGRRALTQAGARS
jgi:hypothetical protein